MKMQRSTVVQMMEEMKKALAMTDAKIIFLPEVFDALFNDAIARNQLDTEINETEKKVL